MTSIFNRRGSYPDLENKKKTMYRPKNLMFQAGGPIETQQMEQQEQPGQEQGQEQQIMQMVAQALQQGTPPEQVMQMLVQQGIPQEQAQQIIQEVMSQMQGQMSPQQPTNGQPMMQQGGYNAEEQIQKLKREMDVFLDPSMSNIPMNQRNSIYNYVNLPFFENKAKQNKKIGKQLLPKQAYDYLINEMGNTPEVRKYTDPYYMVKTQPKYKTGGMRPKGLSYDY